MNRYQTSLGRDLEHGIRLDRNEKISNFSKDLLSDLWSQLPDYCLSASPESENLYMKISKELNVPRDHLFLANGITEGIRILYEFFASPGDNVICLDPTYPMYSIYAKMQQIEYRKFTYNKETLKPDLSTLYSQLDEKTKFVIIPNPNLPIESCFDPKELYEIAKKCKENNTILIVDEAYHFFGSQTVIPYLKDFDNLIIMRTFSKAYGLAGLRIGYMISNPETIQYVSKSRSIVESNTLSMATAEYFLDHPEIKEAHVNEVKMGAKYLQTELNNLGIKWIGANYTNGILIFLKNKEESQSAVQFLKERKIYIRGSFEEPFEATIRISIGSIDSMKSFLKEFINWQNSKEGPQPSL
jgi:histidinol-phosphate aminotransferase